MKVKKLMMLAVALLGLFLIGCAPRAMHVRSQFVSSYEFGGLNCEELEVEKDRIIDRLDVITVRQDGVSRDDRLTTVVGMFIFAPALILTATSKGYKEELSRLKGESMAIDRAIAGCYDDESARSRPEMDSSDGVVIDESTYLMWQKGENDGMEWQQAVSFCGDLSLDGYDDWRLPDLDELKSAYGIKARFPDVHESILFGGPYWSVNSSGSNAGTVHFGNGDMFYRYKGFDFGFYARCVRDGK